MLALADRDGLYGIPRFHQAAERAGVRGIVGAELCVAREEPDPDAPLPNLPKDALRLLVETPQAATATSRAC